MANPAPIIQQISAFDVTQGTTIEFNIIGGTELVRSTKLYIYDNSNNELICTHLYVSTQTRHILPGNTDPSIIYESGKSATDYTNEKQYYATLQTFTDTAGTEGASGVSNATLFWGLLNPTVTFDAVPTNIETTSYNFTAVFNNQITTANVTNEIQQYEFTLYNESNVMVQSSGVIFGQGTPTGEDNEWSISYNFSGLENDVAYHAMVTIVTTQGMTATAISGSLTVSLSTVAFAKASVTNNACDGYITIVSNITNIVGQTNVDISDLNGQIDLTGDGYLIWNEGFTFPTISVPNVGITSRWTMELWGLNFEPSSVTDTESFLIHLQDTGDMYFYVREYMWSETEDEEEQPYIRVDLYVYPYTQDVPVSSYLQSNGMPKPDNTQLLDIWVRCIDGWYDLELHVANTTLTEEGTE